jgi:hypothetical protein
MYGLAQARIAAPLAPTQTDPQRGMTGCCLWSASAEAL